MAKSFDEYAKGKRVSTAATAWLETIPEYDEVVAAWCEGASPKLIRMWLRDECGYGNKVTEGKVDGILYQRFPRA
jgi:hypothetical protein